MNKPSEEQNVPGEKEAEETKPAKDWTKGKVRLVWH
jgi:hypothetical protein